ncbi:heavy-metal-associated domain-containing protein [Liquorilactobacillus sicerae]|uniref:heavy-metal-associated domain-containing protein n=1 Tax=Liquorilactobacillus sicerae TaxID=1416943 RepID=UPI00247FCAE3|nr:heavy metal-associated domain-containing protein [Liquorilactobacillus sicerae]
MSKEVLVSGMKCSGCADKVEKAFTGLDGVDQVKVSLAAGKASFNGQATLEELNNALVGTHYHVDKFVD